MADFFIADKSLDKGFFGSTSLSSIWVGSTKVWPSVPKGTFYKVDGTNLHLRDTADTGYTEYKSGDGVIASSSASTITNVIMDTPGIKLPENCSQMFWMYTALTTVDTSQWDTSEVTNMMGMFTACSSLTALDVSNWDVSKVTNMMYLFAVGAATKAVALTGTLDVSNWDTSSVTNLCGTFAGYLGTTLEVSNWDTSHVTTFESIFSGCVNVTSLDVSNWDTSQATVISGMFSYCQFTSLDVSNWDVSKVTKFTELFQDCSLLTSLDLSQWDMSSAIKTYGMFEGCSALITITCGNDWNTGTITSSDLMFKDCTSLVGAISYDSTKIDINYANPTTGYFTN